jgi:hypothetical protein
MYYSIRSHDERVNQYDYYSYKFFMYNARQLINYHATVLVSVSDIDSVQGFAKGK